jgi:DNA processing protein
MGFLTNRSAIGDKDYPPLLKEISDAPLEIFYLGKLPAPQEKLIAFVGTRKATHDGVLITRQISRDMIQAGFMVVSGLAFGIDAAAHQGALIDGGRTVAVLANGLQPIHPRAHQNLAQKILEQNGCIIAEESKSGPYYDGQFLKRNRIISGLCSAVLVIEAPIRSGSLSTARHALNQGREVFVVPGPAGHKNYEGSHMLLREGARLVTSAKEILEDLNIQAPIAEVDSQGGGDLPIPQNIDDQAQILIFKTIQQSKEPLNVDRIVEITKLEPSVANQKLTFLMLRGLIEEKNGKFRIANK